MNYEMLPLYVGAGGLAGLMLLERLRPGRKFPEIRFWTVRGLLVSLLAFGLSIVYPLLWDHLLAPYQLIDGSGLGTIGGAIVGMLAVEGIGYWWHRALHRSDTLWRWSHQMHHSIERIDAASALYFSPIDMIGWSAVSSLALVLGIGLTVEATMVASSALLFLNLFTHSNLRTPRWLGYFVARPENHARHHERGVHAFNYSVLPIFDILFGTFDNPERWEAESGFYLGASARIPEMLLGRDVSTPKEALDPSLSPSR